MSEDYVDNILRVLVNSSDDYCDILKRVASLYCKRYGNKLYKAHQLTLEQCLFCSHCWIYTGDIVFPHCGHLVCRRCLKTPVKTHCGICLSKYSDLDRHIKPNMHLNNIISVVMKDTDVFFEKKNIANDKLRRELYFEAIRDYTALLNEGFCHHIILSNRCHAYMMIDKLQLASEDSEALLKCAWSWYKAHYRHAMILKRQNNIYRMVEALLNALIRKPSDALLLSELKEAIGIILKNKGKSWISNAMESVITLDKIQEEILIDIINQYNGKYLPNIERSTRTTCNLFRCKSLNKINPKKSYIFGVDNHRLQVKCRLNEIRDKLKINDFDCSLCIRICINPVAVICGHTFCKHCIQRTIDHIPACPLCKADLRIYFEMKHIPVSLQLKNILNLLWPIEVIQHDIHYENELVSLTKNPSYRSFMVCTVALPGMPCDLHLFEPRYRLMLRRAQEANDMKIGMVLEDTRSLNGHCEIGVMLEVKKVELLSEGRYFINACASTTRYRITESSLVDGYLMGKIERYVDNIAEENKIKLFDILSLSVYRSAQTWIRMQTISTRCRIAKYFGELPYYEPYTDIKEDQLCCKANPKSTFNSRVYERKRKSSHINIDSSIEPSLWIWWLSAVLPVEDKIKYVLLSCRDPIFRMEQMKKIITSLISRNAQQNVH